MQYFKFIKKTQLKQGGVKDRILSNSWGFFLFYTPGRF